MDAMELAIAGVTAAAGVGLLAAAVFSNITGAITFAERAWQLWREHVLRRPDPRPATADQVAEIKRTLDELASTLLAPPQGASPPSTEALVGAATPRTKELLTEALQLWAQHKEREAIERVLDAYKGDLPAKVDAQLNLLVGNGLLRLSEYERAQWHLNQALEAARRVNDRPIEAAALGRLAEVQHGLGDLSQAAELHQTALALYKELGDESGQAYHMGGLGVVHVRRGNLDVAEGLFKDALAIFERIRDLRGQGYQNGNLMTVYFLRRDLAMAEHYCRKALTTLEESDDKNGIASSSGNLGLIFMDRGDFAEAEDCFTRALAICVERGDRLGQANQLANLGLLFWKRRETARALHSLRDARELYASIGAKGHGPDMVEAVMRRIEGSG